MLCDLGQARIGTSSAFMGPEGRAPIPLRDRETPMEGGIIWLATIGSIVALAALILGIGVALRRRRSRDR